jgi:hypothetical protein
VQSHSFATMGKEEAITAANPLPNKNQKDERPALLLKAVPVMRRVCLCVCVTREHLGFSVRFFFYCTGSAPRGLQLRGVELHR